MRSSGSRPTESSSFLLDASASEDPDGQIIRYQWSFGDGETGVGMSVVHTFPAAGTHSVTLTVEDNAGATSSVSRPVTVSGTGTGGWQIPGDGNQDGGLDIADAVTLLFHLFVGSFGPSPCDADTIVGGGNKALLEVNQVGGVDLTDPLYLLNLVFRGGPAPLLGTSCVRVPGCPDACAH